MFRQCSNGKCDTGNSEEVDMKRKELEFRKVERAKCKMKQRFPSEKLATEKMIKYWGSGAHYLARPYRCPWCKQWHLTSRDRVSRPFGKKYVIPDDDVYKLGKYSSNSA